MSHGHELARGRRLAALGLLAITGALSLISCGESSADTPTQVVVLIEAEPQTQARSDALHFWVTAQDEPHLVLDKTMFTPEWPIKIVLEPRHGDIERTYQVVAETGDNTMQMITRARFKSGYVDGSIRYVRLVLEDACLEVSNSCEQPETCHMGACVTAIRVDPERFATSSERAPNAAELDLPPPSMSGATAGAGDGDYP